MQRIACQPLLPVGRQHAVRGTGHDIFGDAVAEGKYTRDEIMVPIRCGRGHDHDPIVLACLMRQRGQIRLESGDHRRAIVDRHMVAADAPFKRYCAQSFGHTRRRRLALGRSGWKIQP